MAEEDWIEGWLSEPRFAPYRAAAEGSRPRGLELYEWNTTIAAALHHDLAHLEIGLRNAYDRALCSGLAASEQHWVFDPYRFFLPTCSGQPMVSGSTPISPRAV